MTNITIVNETTNITGLVGEDGEIVLTRTGQILIDDFVPPDDGIRDVESTAWHVTVTVFGEIHVQWDGIFIRAVDSTITVGSTGIVSGQKYGVAFNQGSRLVNDGSVTGVLAGVLASLENTTIHNTGSISGTVGILGNRTPGDEADHTVLANFGSVSGTTHGVWLSNSSVVTNAGSIAAAGHGVLLGTLAGDVGQLTNTGTITAAIAVEGGAGSEVIVNTGSLQGEVRLLDGDDLYDGRGGSVSGAVDLGAGNDIAQGGNGAEHLLGGVGDDKLYGGGGNDILEGGDGDDLLDGGEGGDVLRGGDGDDVYVVDSLDDMVSETVAAGSDTVRSSISWTLGANVENLVLTGAGNLSGTGNDVANTLVGNGGANTLTGGGGDDLIDGGDGEDVALFSGLKSDYDFALNGDGSVSVTDRRAGQDGHDTLFNIETIQFVDGTISLKAPSAPILLGAAAPVNENAPANTVVATLQSNSSGEVAYSLASDLGGRFAIDARTGVIMVVGQIDYEASAAADAFLTTEISSGVTRKFYTLQVKAVTTGGLALGSALTPVKVYVNDVNEAPDTLSFTNGSNAATIGGAIANGTVVGTLEASDPEGDNPLVYSFDSTGAGGSSGAGNANGLFKIENGVLKFARAPSSTEMVTYTVTVKVTDKGAGEGSKSFYRDFIINAEPGGTSPTPNVLSVAADSASLNEGAAGAFTEFTFTVTRANASGTTGADWAISPNGNLTAEDFDGGVLPTGQVIFGDGETSATITVRVKGDAQIEADEVFAVRLTGATNGEISAAGHSASSTILNDDHAVESNLAPTDIQLSGPSSAGEYAAAGTLIGSLTASDADSGDSFTYALLRGNERFEIVGDKVVVKNGYKLDFEQAASHDILVRVTDTAGGVFDKAFQIGVINVNPEFTLGSAENDIFKGGRSNDRLGGGAGDDILWGGYGNDTLTGHAGRDTFVFNTKLNKRTNKDKIVDFNVRDDSIWLDNAIFKKLGKKGTESAPAKLNKQFFRIGDKAKDKNDYLVYDKKKAVLYYDSDGSGKAKAVEIATLKKNLKMTYKDFFII